MSSVRVEVCVDTVQSLEAAIAGGANRIELCSALALGGLTPSMALAQEAARAPVPVYAMIRPRAGDFIYSAGDVDIMANEIALLKEAGLAGIVIGASRDGDLDAPILKRLLAAAGDMGATLHRVFDLLDNPLKTIDVAVDLGFERILTSGGSVNALEGSHRLREFVAYAGGRISIMAGGGINARNVTEIIARTRVHEIHGSFSTVSRHYAHDVQALGFATTRSLSTTDAGTVRNVCNLINND